MADNYYAIVNKSNGALLVISSQLPIFWNKKVANEVAKSHPRYEVKPVSIDEFNKLLKKQITPAPADKKILWKKKDMRHVLNAVA